MPGKTLLLGMALAIARRRISDVLDLSTGGVSVRVCSHSAKALWVAFGWESFNPLQNWLQHPKEPDISAITFMCGGFAFVFLLNLITDAPAVVDTPSVGLCALRGIVGWAHLLLVPCDGELAD